MGVSTRSETPIHRPRPSDRPLFDHTGQSVKLYSSTEVCENDAYVVMVLCESGKRGALSVQSEEECSKVRMARSIQRR